MRAALLLTAMLAVPPLAAGGGDAWHAFGVGLGKSYDPVQCYAPATQEMVVDWGDATVFAKTVNPCGLVPLGGAVFEHTFAFAECDFPGGVRVNCEALAPDGLHLARLGGHDLPSPAVSMLYLIRRDHDHWTETLAGHGVLLTS